jgi:hypothetical protein
MAKKSWPWIVGHIPRNLESGEVSLTELPSVHLEFRMSHIRWTGSAELRSECYLGMVLFGRSCRMNRPKIVNKVIQKKENGVYKRQGYKGD